MIVKQTAMAGFDSERYSLYGGLVGKRVSCSPVQLWDKQERARVHEQHAIYPMVYLLSITVWFKSASIFYLIDFMMNFKAVSLTYMNMNTSLRRYFFNVIVCKMYRCKWQHSNTTFCIHALFDWAMSHANTPESPCYINLICYETSTHIFKRVQDSYTHVIIYFIYFIQRFLIILYIYTCTFSSFVTGR